MITSSESLKLNNTTVKNPVNFKPKFDDMYGFGRDTMGLQNFTDQKQLGKDNLNIGNVQTDIIPGQDTNLDLGSQTKSWKSVYSQKYFNSLGEQLLMFKRILCDHGDEIIADSLTDTLILTSSDSSLTITSNPDNDSVDFKANLDGSFLKLDGSNGPVTGSLVVNGDLSTGGNLKVNTLGKGLQIKTGVNATAGTQALIAGVATISTTAVTANSIIILTPQETGALAGVIRITARTPGTSFVVTSSNLADTAVIGWILIESI